MYGKSQKLQVNAGVNSLVFVPDDGSANLALKPRRHADDCRSRRTCRLRATARSPTGLRRRSRSQLRVLDASGRTGTLDARAHQLHACARVEQRPGHSGVRTGLVDFAGRRTRIRTRAFTWHPNCSTATTARRRRSTPTSALATQGMSVSEILGSGSACDAQPEILAEANAADLRSVAHAHRDVSSTLEVTANRSAVEGGADALSAGVHRRAFSPR